jgi:hypothetical protein
MHGYMLEEMADALSNELQVPNHEALAVLSRYWEDKIAHVWSVEDVYKCAHRAEKPITREGAIEVLERVFDKTDSEMGIGWINIDVFLNDYHLDFKALTPEQHSEVHGVFCVWRKSDPFNHQFGLFPNEESGNLPEALEFAKRQAREIPSLPVYIACELYASEELEPWISVLVEEPGKEPILEEGAISWLPSNQNNMYAS